MERSTFSEDNSVSFGIRSSLLNKLMLLYEPAGLRRRKERNYFLFAGQTRSGDTERSRNGSITHQLVKRPDFAN
jgi:hypothetical protein